MIQGKSIDSLLGLRRGGMVDDAGVAELVKYLEPTRQDTLGDEPLDDAAVCARRSREP
jgi:hypothetical protein